MTTQPSDWAVELLPCPFCGGQPKFGETNTGVPGMEDCGYAFVECCIVHAHSEESVEDAIEKWNTRTHSAEIAGALRDAERMEWLTSMAVEVRTPLRYGSAALFHARPDNDEGEPYHTTLRAQIDSAMQQGGGGG